MNGNHARHGNTSFHTLFFLHIPKTGGQTLFHILRKPYSADKVLSLTGKRLHLYEQLPPHRKAGLRLVSGHMPFGYHQLQPTTCAYVTLLREPLARAVSSYKHIIQQPQHPWHEKYLEENTALAEHLMNPRFDNFQLRRILWDTEHAKDGFAIDNHAYTKAVERLERHFILAGTLEQFDETLLLLMDILHHPVPSYEKKNVSGSGFSEQIPGEIRDDFLQRNHYDMKLYRFVADRLEQQIETTGKSFRERHQVFRAKSGGRKGTAHIPAVKTGIRDDSSQQTYPGERSSREIIRANVILWDKLDKDNLGAMTEKPGIPLGVYLHIPKTGGQTFQSILGTHLRPSTIFHIPGDREDYSRVFATLPETVRGRIRFIIGHIPINTPIYHHIKRPFYHFTMLRNPVDRLVSQYHFILDNEWHPSHKQFHEQKITLAQYASPRGGFTGQNAMLHYLSGKARANNSSLETAKRNLRELFTFFGLTERYDELLLVIQAVMKFENVYYRKRNVSGKTRRNVPTSETLRLVREAVKYDLLLYEYAQELYKERIALFGEVLEAQLSDFRKTNREIALLTALKSSSPLSRQTTVLS